MGSKILTAAPHRLRPGFLPLFYALAGWGLAQAWLVLIQASAGAHLLAAVPALSLVALAARRAGAGRSVMGNQILPSAGARPTAAHSALPLLVLGAAFGLLVVTGSALLLAMAALSLTLVPAAWLPFGMQHVGVPVFIMGVGFLSVVLPGFATIELMTLPLLAWAFWLCACCPLLLGIEQSWRAERARQAGPEPVGAELGVAGCDG